MKWIVAVIAMLALAPVARGQILTEGFERWDSVETKISPPGWLIESLGLTRTEEAHGGRYAAQINTWYGTVPGYLITAEPSESPWVVGKMGIPISYKPSVLTGYYRYLLGDNLGRNDSAIVRVALQRYNAQTEEIDTIAFGEKHLGPAATYIPFSVDIVDMAPGIDPNLVMIFFQTSENAACGGAGTCCTLNVDDLRLSPTSSVPYGDAPLIESARVYPSPMRTSTRVEWNAKPGCAYTLLLYSATGELLRKLESIAGGAAKLDRAGLPSGEYFFEIRDQANVVAACGRVIAE